MVSTRHHPTTFPPPEQPAPAESPSKNTRSRTNASLATDESATPPPSTSLKASPTKRGTRRSITASKTTTKKKGKARKEGVWFHTPSRLTILWLVISIPLVIWDTGYVLLRPLTMPGGSLHSPIWTPYALYGTVDYIYGFPAWEANNGFTAAQGSLNVLETLMYAVYLYMVLSYGENLDVQGAGAPSVKYLGWISEARVLGGKEAGAAVLLGFSAAVMTVSKTVLYWLNEHFSGYHNIGHNDLSSLIFLWIIPNGAWLVVPSYMIYVMGKEILEGLAVATGETGGMNGWAIKDE
ncbi:MAG: hypothetical protein MMC33_006381 [Icmadophila ericetorum]|nr:hypothetical protein [Icmadophila ericetorum]